jgi:hypothetical protein
MAVNPGLIWGPSRPAGVLYSVDAQTALPGVGSIFTSVPAAEAPTIEAESTSNGTANSTELRALINPHGSSVSYLFEYLSEADYLANGGSFQGPNTPAKAPVGGGRLPNAGSISTASAVVSGLKIDTPYRFRVVASSACNPVPGEPLCIVTGAPASFATYPLAEPGLPDGRAFELVSPALKNGGEAFPAQPNVGSCLLGLISECKPPGGSAITTVYPMQATPDGDAVAYMGFPFSATEGSAVFNSYVSRRSASVWQTSAMSPPLLGTKSGQNLTYNDDLTEGMIRQGNPQLSPQAPSGYENLYFQNAADPGALIPLVTETPPVRSPLVWAIAYKGSSADFQRQFFSANDVLTRATAFAPEPPSIPPSGRDLYEWVGGALSLVNVLPGNATIAEGAAFASESPDAHGIAANGRRVFWTAGGHLYVREDGQITREVEHPGAFIAASENGLQVLLSDGCVYSLLTEGCTDLTKGQGGFLGLAGTNADLSRIYFVDKAALAPEAEAGACKLADSSNTQAKKEEAEGKVPPGLGCNLYFYEAGSGTHFIASLWASDGSGATGNDWQLEPKLRTAEASPDGAYLAFVSAARLTGYSTVGACKATESGIEDVPCPEVMLYQSNTGQLSCVSCNPTGEAPRGLSTLRLIKGAPAWLPQPRYLTNQGRLFFDSQDRLSSRDTNGRVEDVYEREPFGVGSCTRVQGCVSLISPGTGVVDSNFLTMGGQGAEEGADVFFTTRERLVPNDEDELIDVYDARVGGGFSSESDLKPAECSGEACQMPPTPPVPATPSTQGFSGAGNFKPVKCSKGKVKKKGKCVKQKHSKKKKHGSAAKRGRGK